LSGERRKHQLPRAHPLSRLARSGVRTREHPSSLKMSRRCHRRLAAFAWFAVIRDQKPLSQAHARCKHVTRGATERLGQPGSTASVGLVSLFITLHVWKSRKRSGSPILLITNLAELLSEIRPHDPRNTREQAQRTSVGAGKPMLPFGPWGPTSPRPPTGPLHTQRRQSHLPHLVSASHLRPHPPT